MPPIRHALDLNFFTAASTSTGCCHYIRYTGFHHDS